MEQKKAYVLVTPNWKVELQRYVKEYIPKGSHYKELEMTDQQINEINALWEWTQAYVEKVWQLLFDTISWTDKWDLITKE